jgi:hypothetical protein
MLNMFRPRWPQKTNAYFRRTVHAGSNIIRGRSGTLGVVSTFGGTWPSLRRRSEQAPRPAALEPQPAVPEDLSPAHGFGGLALGLVLLASDLAKLQLPLLHLLGLGSHLPPHRENLCSSRHRLCPRHRCLRLWLIVERPKVLKLSQRGFKRQGRPSPGTNMPPGYGYLTRHLPRKATHTRLSGSATDRQVLVLETRKKHSFILEYPNVQASTATKNKYIC